MKRTTVHGVVFIWGAATLAACSDAGTRNDLVAPKATEPQAVAAAVVAASAMDQNATAGTTVPSAPVVVVKTAGGSGLAGVPVSFVVTTGGGTIQHASVTTDAQGVAGAGNWTLGSTAGTHRLEARVAGLAPVVFTATAAAAQAPAGAYSIVVRYVSGASARQQQAVATAVTRWQSAITADLMNIPLSSAAKSCFETQPAINETVDDILIFVEFVDIDGVGKVLGQAGPCYVRSDNNLPVMGHLKLDAADLAYMEQIGTLDDVVMHEIGHVLGIGTLWTTRGLLAGEGTPDPRFTGTWALSSYRTLGGAEASIPVENTGGEGTRDGHWRESSFGNELMTGYISGPNNPLSMLTVSSLSDLGYGTNPGAASAFTLNRSAGSARPGIDLHGREQMLKPRYKVDHRGRKTRFSIE